MLKNRDSWAFAFPPLLFLILPLYYMSAGFPQISYLVAFFLMVLFGAFYVAAWLQIPYRPRRLSSLNIAILAGLIATYLGGWWIAGTNAPVAFQASYLCSVAIFLLPARLDYYALGIIYLLTMLQVAISPSITNWSAVLITIFTSLACFAGRSSVEAEKRRTLAAASETQAAKMRERARINADLHDVLGQTLTAISLNAQLSSRLLQQGRNQDAASALRTVQLLSRQALADVRQVVSASREIVIAEEIENARALCQAANITFSVNALDTIKPEIENLAAWMIREGISNLVHHSGSDKAWLLCTAKSVCLIDNGKGYQELVSDSDNAGSIGNDATGNGLCGLKDRAKNLAVISYGNLFSSAWEQLIAIDPEISTRADELILPPKYPRKRPHGFFLALYTR